MGTNLRPYWTPDAVVFSVEQFRRWLFLAAQGERCLYHIGQMLIDQEDRPVSLKPIGDYAAIMAEYRAVILTQKRTDEGIYQYFAVRTDVPTRTMPRAVSVGDVSVEHFIALKSIHNKENGLSAHRAIRFALGCSQEKARDVMHELIAAGLLEDGRAPSLTKAGRKALV